MHLCVSKPNSNRISAVVILHGISARSVWLVGTWQYNKPAGGVCFGVSAAPANRLVFQLP